MNTEWIKFKDREPEAYKTILVTNRFEIHLGYIKKGILHESITGEILAEGEELENWYWTLIPELP